MRSPRRLCRGKAPPAFPPAVRSAPAIETGGKESGQRSLARTTELARREGVRVIFVQAQIQPARRRDDLTGVGGRVVAVDPLAEDYLRNMRTVTRQ